MLEFLLYLASGIGYGFYFDLNLFEAALVVVVLFVLPLGWVGRSGARRTWRAWVRLASRRKTAVLSVFLFGLTARFALLPVLPVPHPTVTDEFSHLLIADTFAHGRLSNPTHAMWEHFETIHVIQKPTYNSDYFPGQGAVLALGKLLGHPWIAVWLLSAAMCAALCWMLQGWIPPAWALFGGVLAVLRFGLASYWINGYYGGCLAALGGALALGAYPRLRNRPGLSNSLLFGLGLAMVLYARPFEGTALAIPAVLGIVVLLAQRRLPLWTALPPALVVAAALGFLLSYCKAVTGDPLRMPYAVNQATYGWPMTLPWFHPPQVTFRHEELRRYYDYEREVHDRNDSLAGELKHSTLKAQEIWRFYFGPALSMALLVLARIWRSRRIRLPMVVAGLTLLASLVETGSSPHYAAAATGCFLVIVVEGLRKLRIRGRRVAFVAVAVVALVLVTRIALEQLHLPFTQKVNFQSWCCVTPGNEGKSRILSRLHGMGGRHLVVVKPKTDPDNLFQWIYNDADIDASSVIWARDVGQQDNAALIDYFRDRTIWLLDPNTDPVQISPYPR
jgi:hypothetical protein